jgi:AraC family transcriptional regulator
MEKLQKGHYMGTNNRQTQVGGVIFSETHFKAGYSSGWHYHENPYITLVLEGGSTELRKKDQIDCRPGTVIMYDFDEPHRNIDYKPNSRTLSVEFERTWLSQNDLNRTPFVSKGLIRDYEIKFLLLKIIHEEQQKDPISAVSVEALVGLLLTTAIGEKAERLTPPWVDKIRELLNDQWSEVPTLAYLSRQLDVHPVTISKYFPKYFNCTLGNYMRRIKVDKAVDMIRQTNHSNREIALQCGFSDASHFNRVFKMYTGSMPSEFRTL